MNNAELIDNNQLLDNVSKRKGQPEVANADHSGGHDSNDAAGGYPRSPGGANELAADQKMDDDTGLSNTVNEQQPVDARARQAGQSNVGRRDDMTAD
jgi:hypothetical protein